MLVKGRRIVLPPLFGSFLPSVQRLICNERLVFVLTVERVRICLLIDKFFSKAIFNFSYTELFSPARVSLRSLQVYFPFHRKIIWLLTINLQDEQMKVKHKIYSFFLRIFCCFFIHKINNNFQIFSLFDNLQVFFVFFRIISFKT